MSASLSSLVSPLRFESSVVIQKNAQNIFFLYRDELEKYSSNIEYVSNIEIEEYEDMGNHLIKIIRIWTPNLTVIPAVIRSYTTFLQYKDEAYWDDHNLRVLFTITPYPLFTSFYNIKGLTVFHEISNTETEIKTVIELDVLGSSLIPQSVINTFGELVTTAMKQTALELSKYT